MTRPPKANVWMWVQRYLDLGWRIIPAGHGKDGKKPPARFEWKPYQTTAPTATELGAWFSNGQTNAPAVLLGNASGGLCCRDFDIEDEYHAWSLEHRDLADILPTVETGRGFHVYFRLADGEEFITLADGELRGNLGHYCILPPAVHKDTGKTYTWIIEPTDDNIMSFSRKGLVDAGFVPPDFLNSLSDTEDTQRHSVPSVSSVSVQWGAGVLEAIERALAATTATGARQRNGLIFTFARKLKAVPELCDRRGAELQRLVRTWWERSLPYIVTKDFMDTYGDFLRAWDSVRVPANEDFMSEIIDKARKSPEATGFGEELDILAAVCRELQRVAGKEPFFLSVRDAATPFGGNETWGSRRLKVLEAEGWIECVERGSPQTQRATRWRWIGGPSAQAPKARGGGGGRGRGI